MSDSAYTILIAEDDDSIRHALTDVLTASGYEVLALEEGLAAIHAVRERNFDLALLDVAMPGADGFQVLQVMSEERPGTPVIMLTARGEEEDRVQGLKLGADDYIVKPFSIRELLARIRVVLRRMENAGLPEGSDRQDGMLCMHGLCMNPQTLKVTLNNEPLDLTSMEFQLLYHLARGAGRIFSREDLLNLFAEKEWNKFDRCVDVHISSLRKKLGDNSRCPTYLKTVRGLGYMFIKQSDAWP